MKKLFAVTSLLVALAGFVGCSDQSPLDPATVGVGELAPVKRQERPQLPIPAADMGIVHNALMSKALEIYDDFDDLKGTYGFFAGGELESYTVWYLKEKYNIPAEQSLAWCREAQLMPYPEHWSHGGKPTPLKTWLDPQRAAERLDESVRLGYLSAVGAEIAKETYAKVSVMPGGCTWEEAKKYIGARIRQLPPNDYGARATLEILVASIDLQQDRLGMGDDDTTPGSLWSVVAGVDATAWCCTLNPCATVGASVLAYIIETWND